VDQLNNLDEQQTTFSRFPQGKARTQKKKKKRDSKEHRDSKRIPPKRDIGKEMGSKGRTKERDYKTKSSCGEEMQKARTAAAAAAGDCFPALVPNWLASPSRARTPLGSPPSPRSYLSVRTISKIRTKDKYKWTVYIRWGAIVRT
jgi:hypothetical protein